MKRVLNLNHYSVLVLTIIALIGLVFPAVLWLTSYALDQVGMKLPVLDHLAGVFLRIGIVFLLLFFVLVILEQIQDSLLYRRYLQERGQQVDGECPYCGNRQLRSFEHFCPVCGGKIHQKKAAKD